jgi:hypothetical protein
MVASLLKIVSTGMQDERLQPPKGQPDLGSFLTVMVKAGRYATNWTRIDFDTAPDFGKSSVIRLPTKGEMIGRIYLVTQMPDIATIQRKAYYSRKPIRLANSNYTQIRLFEGESYIQTTNLSFPKFSRSPIYPSPDYGLANFSGYQLDDLNIDAIYTLTLSLPPNTSATSAITTFLLTDVALKNPQFTELNTDTFLIACIGGSIPNPNGEILGFMYSYNGREWKNSPVFTGFNTLEMGDIAYNGSQYIATGIYSSKSKSIIIENTTQTLIDPGFNTSRRIAYNGTQYVSVGFLFGSLDGIFGFLGSISYSSDGLSWVRGFNPPGIILDISNIGGNSVIWNPSISKWIAVGAWNDTTTGVSGIITTSTNGITWTQPTFITTAAYIFSQNTTLFTDLPSYSAALNLWYVNITSLNDYATGNNLSGIKYIYDTNIQPTVDSITACNSNSPYCDYTPLATILPTMLTYLSEYSASIQLFIDLLTTVIGGNVNLDQEYDAILILLETYYNYIIPLSNIPSLSFYITSYTNNLQVIRSATSRFTNDTLPESETLDLLTSLRATVEPDGAFYNSLYQVNDLYNTAYGIDPGYINVTDEITAENGPWYTLYQAINSLSTTASNLNTEHLAALSKYAEANTAEIQNAPKVTTFDYINIDVNLPNVGLASYTNILPVNSGKATCIAVNGLNIVIGGQFYRNNDNTNYLGTLIYSADGGTTWTFPTDPAGSVGEIPYPIANDVAWTGSVWVAAGKWTTGTISFSQDGVSWLAAINPLNTSTGIAYTIGLSPTEMVVGGLWDLNDLTTGSLSKASGTTLDFKWINIVRPTQILTDTVNIYGISYASSNSVGSYIILGEWIDPAEVLIGTISLSTDAITWSPPIYPADLTRVHSRAYAAASNGSRWVVVGYWRTFENPLGNSIVYSNNLSPQFYSDWSFSDELRTGYAQNIIFDSYLDRFIVLGSWSNGYISVSVDDGGTSFNSPVFLTGTTSGTGYSITASAIENVYILGGSFLINASSRNESLASITIASGSGAITLNAFITPEQVDLTKVQLASGVAWNGLNGELSAYIAVGRWVLLDSTYATLCYSNDGTTWQQPFNPPGIESSSTNIANSVTWNGTQFVAMGAWNGMTISASIDGQSWTAPTKHPLATGTANTGSAATWNGTAWVASGNWVNALGTAVGNVTSFTYGINFAKPVHPSDAVIGTTRTVAWNPNTNKWLAGAHDTVWSDNTNINLTNINLGTLTSSTDGLNWTTPTNLNGVLYFASFSQIAVINSRVYIIGLIVYNYQSIMTSTNGIDWSIQPFTDNKSGNGVGIAFNGTEWVTVGSNFTKRSWGIFLNGPILVSTDGQTWSDPIFPIVPITPIIQGILNSPAAEFGVRYTSSLSRVVWNGQLWVAVGTIQMLVNDPEGEVTYYIGQIVTSSEVNSLIWTLTPITAMETIDNYRVNQNIGNSVAWNGQLWVVVGSFGLTPTRGYITTSRDGISWSTPISPVNVISGVANDVAWNGNIWIVVGSWQDVEGYEYNIMRSTDGITWSPAISAIPSTFVNLSKITWNGTIFTAPGITPFTGTKIVLVSPDGITWSNIQVPLGEESPIVKIISKRIQPFTTPQPPDPTITVFSQAQSNGYTLSWVRDDKYGTGDQVLTTLTPGQPFTYTFRATKKTQWLTLGTYYSPPSIIDISLNLLTPAEGSFQTDLAGPHFGWTNSLGHSLIDSASITIGGNLVETINGQLMEVLDEFQTPLEKVNEKSRQLCRAETGFTQKTFGYSGTSGQTTTTHLPFWFSRGDPGCVLPIDALNVDEVRLTVNFKPITSLYYTDSRNALPAINVEGGSLWPMANSKFYYEDSSGTIMPNLEPFRSYIEPTIAFPNIQMPATYSIQDSHLMVEYIYLDKAEANRFRIADLQVPIVQHYTLNPEDTNKNTYAKIRLDIPNPTRDLFFYCQRYEAPSLNAHFLATRDLSKNQTNPYSLWWPDASGLDARFYQTLRPGFSTSGSEPIRWLALNYSETLNRYSTENVALFRSLMPSMEQRKAPWINRYYYNLPFGCQNGLNPISMPLGNANLDKVQRISLALGFHGITGDPTDSYTERFWVRTFAETYNIFRVYGGRGTMMFAY